MRSRTLRRQSVRGAGLLLATLVAWPGPGGAAAPRVLDSVPAANATIPGRHEEYFRYYLRFDGPVDHVASRIEITRSGRVVDSLAPRVETAVDVLFAFGRTPGPGSYVLRWRAVSTSGEVSTGDIAFSVAP
ncbi:MAG: copper resistance protein CopC [Acetobacteraceae bacterium]|nr:copper resistance protein CopC [Acetobacteraceae bacterium]